MVPNVSAGSPVGDVSRELVAPSAACIADACVLQGKALRCWPRTKEPTSLPLISVSYRAKQVELLCDENDGTDSTCSWPGLAPWAAVLNVSKWTATWDSRTS